MLCLPFGRYCTALDGAPLKSEGKWIITLIVLQILHVAIFSAYSCMVGTKNDWKNRIEAVNNESKE